MQAAMRVASRQSGFLASPMTAAPRRLAVAPVKLVTVEVQAGTGGKLKTRKAAAKRFKVTGSGKVMARRSGKQHFNEKMSRDEIRAHSKMYVLETANIPNAIKCLPNSGIKGGH